MTVLLIAISFIVGFATGVGVIVALAENASPRF